MTEESLKNILDNLPDFLEKETPSNNYKLLKSIGINLDNIKTQIDNLKSTIRVSTATNSSLDNIGALFKLNRITGETDSNYRSRILSYWSSAKGGGIAESIKNAIIGATILSDLSIVIEDIEPGILKITITPPLSEMGYNFDLLYSTAEFAKAAGVYIFYYSYLNNDLFQESIDISERVDIVDSSDDGYMKCELSIMGDTLVPTCGDYYAGYFLTDYSRTDGDDLVL